MRNPPASTTAALLVWFLASCASPLPDPDGRSDAPRERKDYLFDAVRLAEARKYDQAVALLLQLQAEEDPADAPTTHYLLASAYAGMDDHVNAAAQYAAVTASDHEVEPEVMAAARLGAGHYSFLAARYDDAILHLSAWYETVEAPAPSTLMELAQAYSWVGAHDRAVAVAEAALGGPDASDANDSAAEPEWLQMLADFYYRNGQYTESLAAQDRADARRATEFDSLQRRVGSSRHRAERRAESLPDTDTLRTLEAQTRALLGR